MFIVALIFSLLNGYDNSKLLLVMFLIVYRGFDAFLDSFHAIIQKRDKIYKIGVLTFFRTILLILSFFIVSLLFKNILISVSTIIIVDLVYTITFEYFVTRKLIVKTKYNKYKNILLLVEGFAVCILSFLAMYILNSPKYSIDVNLNDELQGIFGIIFMPSSFMSLISLYLVQPFLNEISDNIKNNDIKKQNILIIKLSGIVFVLGLLITLVAYVIGIPVLEFIYGIDLNNYRIDLVIIMIGTLFYSIYTIFYSVLIALRKNIYQIFILFVVSILALIICNKAVVTYGLRGASIAYLLIMLIQLLLYLFVYIYLTKIKKEHKKKLVIRLMGGLGNQMFQYASLRMYAKKYNIDAYIDLRGITNKTHNVYGLNHCNISKDVIVVDKYPSIKAFFSHLLYGLSWVIFKDNSFYKDIQPIINSYGIYCAPLGYVEFSKPQKEVNYMVGYYSSREYVDNYDYSIKEELQITDKLTGKNKRIFDDMIKNNSVCIHIRKGDYVGSMFDVCTDKYYLNAYKEMKKKVKNAKFYIFSDNIEWVKNNLEFDDDVTFVDWKNNQYEDLKLMSSCKHFIMSNSTFSYWAQYLSNNKNKNVIAPSKWYRDGRKTDLYEDNWILMDVE